MDFSANSMMASLIVSTVGLGLFRYGKKQERAPQMYGGMAMMVYPMFVTGAGSMLAIAGGIVAAITIASNAGY